MMLSVAAVKDLFFCACRWEFEVLKQGPRHPSYGRASLVWKGFKAGLVATKQMEE